MKVKGLTLTGSSEPVLSDESQADVGGPVLVSDVMNDRCWTADVMDGDARPRVSGATASLMG